MYILQLVDAATYGVSAQSEGLRISLDLFLIKFIETCLTKSVDTSEANSNCFLREADRRCAQERLLRLDFYHTMPTSKQKPVHLLF
jgi:hypothetical protein